MTVIKRLNDMRTSLIDDAKIATENNFPSNEIITNTVKNLEKLIVTAEQEYNRIIDLYESAGAEIYVIQCGLIENVDEAEKAFGKECSKLFQHTLQYIDDFKRGVEYDIRKIRNVEE